MTYVEVTFSVHAKERMEERSISRSQASAAVHNPDKLTLDRRNGNLVAERITAAGNTLRIVYTERPSPGGKTAHVVKVIRIGGARI